MLTVDHIPQLTVPPQNLSPDHNMPSQLEQCKSTISRGESFYLSQRNRCLDVQTRWKFSIYQNAPHG